MKATIVNCLKTRFPEVAAEWHSTKNGEINPENVTAESHKKYWFVCEFGHEWSAILKNRTRLKRGCPYCTNQKVCHENCLSTCSPEVAAEWHPTKNGEIAPENVINGSCKKYWFICKLGHEWESIVCNRTFGLKRGCPYCTNRKVCYENCLTTCSAEVAAEWHPVKNGEIIPENVINGSNVKYWFLCEFGHEWKTKLGHRTHSKSRCPVCRLESKGEKKVADAIEKLKFKYKKQWKFNSCKNERPLPFDFVVKTNNGIKAIEYQGGQHFFPVNFFGGEKVFLKLQKRDLIKREWCKERDIPLLEIPYWQFDEIYEITKIFLNS